MKRLLLFSHYNKYDQLSEHVPYLLKNIQNQYKRIVIVSNSSLSEKDRKKLDEFSSQIITRENEGYDFAAWREGMQIIGQEELEKFDSVTIMNDTCFGPVHPFAEVYKTMEKRNLDFWGMVAHRSISMNDSPHGTAIPKHLQSFHISFNRNVVKSQPFKDFWSSIEDHSDVNQVIMSYETQLTKLLSSAGFTYDSFFDSGDFEAPGNHSPASAANFTIYSPETCLEAQVPLVKIKAFTHHKFPSYLLNRIKSETRYPINIIEDYFSEYADPNQQILILDKTIEDMDIQTKQPKVGIHLHAFYMDVAEEFVRRFKKWSFEYDLYITVSSEALKQEISQILAINGASAKKIIVLPNRGYAVIPWIKVANEYLKDYEIAGHFHTKKDAHMEEWVGKVWTGDLMNMLVDPAPNILENFASNKKLGIVVPDVPRHARYLGAEMYYNLTGLKALIEDLYSRLDIDGPRKVNLDDLLAYIYPYGMMYWYRTEALKPITDLKFSEEEIPHGKLPETSLLHAIERLFVYVAWGKGFDYRVSKLQNYTPEFITTISVNKQAYDKSQNTPVLTIGIKGAVKDKALRVSKKIFGRLPQSLKVRVIRAYNTTKNKNSIIKSEPALKLFTHELSNTGGPRVALDLFTQLKADKIISKHLTTELYVPEGAKTDRDLLIDLTDKNIPIKKFSLTKLAFNKGDVVIMNTIAYTDAVFAVIIHNLEIGIIKHLFLYPHEFVVSRYLSNSTISKITKLSRQGKVTIYASAEQAGEVYGRIFNSEKIKHMPNRVDINKDSIFSRTEDDFNEIRFVLTGTPDARKGALDVLYALTSFYNIYYKGNESKYRDFKFTIVGLTDNFKDVYNALYSDRVRSAAKGLDNHVTLYKQQPERKSLEIIKNSNFTILYSLYENLPRVVFDGLAFGHPVLRNDCSGLEEQLIDGVNGWKTSTDDWQGLVDSFEEILNKSKTSNKKLALMSKESEKIAKKYATLEYVVIDDIKNLYSSDNQST